MEHIISMEINIDDDAIRTAVERDAKKQIVESIKADVEKEMGIERNTGRYTYSSRTYSADKVIETIIERICDSCRDRIVEMAAEKLAEKAPRQKWYRDAMTEKVSQ